MDEANISEKEILSYESSKTKGKKYVEKFRKAFIAVGDRPYELQEAIAFFEGDQYKLANLNDTSPWVIQSKTPHAKVNIEKRVSSITASEYVGELFPLKIEDIEPIKMLNELLLDEWERMELDLKIDNCVKDASYMRESYLHFIFNDVDTYGDSRQGVTEANVIDSSSVFLDPNARHWSDIQYLIVTGRKAKGPAIARYPLAKQIKPKQGALTSEERGEINISGDYETEQTDYFSQLTFYEKKYKKGKPYILKTIVLEDVVVDSLELDGLTEFPICQFVWGKKKQSPYGISLMDDIISNQKAINSIDSANTNQAISAASPAVIIKRGVGLNPQEVAETIGVPQMVYSVNGNPSEAMVVFNPNSISDAALQIKREQRMDLESVAGVSSEFNGSLGTAGNTAGGSEAAINRAKIIEGEVLRNITEFVGQITCVLMQYITTQYAGQRVSSLKQDVATREFSVKSYDLPKEVKDIKYKFFVNLNVRTPYAKEQEKAAMMELWQMERQYDSEVKVINVLDIIETYNITNKEELTDRYKRMMKSSLEAKAQVITKLTTLSTQYQLPPELLQQAMVEIMSDAKQTPAVEQLTQMIDQAVMQEQQMAQQQAQVQEQNNTQAAQRVAGELVDQMDPNQVMQMAQQQSAPAQIDQMMQQ